MDYLFELSSNEPRVRQLCLVDHQFAGLVDTIGQITVTIRGDAFHYLVKSLIGQQLSVKAADTICRRVEQSCGDFSPETMLSASEENLRSAGVSRPKINYIKNLAELVLRNELDFISIKDLDNEEVIAVLTEVKGIGRWTAEMFLIFFLGREDVLSLGDAGLRRAANWLYGAEGGLGPAYLEIQSPNWKPYRTIASLYLWEAINLGHVNRV
ncbi:MAG: DNA-3-methyladenine glycosylase [Candidatus Pristimantibacillus sp.]